MNPSPDIAKMEARLRVLTEANWHRQQQLMYMGAACSSLEYTRALRLSGKRVQSAAYLNKTAERLQHATRHYTIQRELEGKNVHP